MRCLSRISRGTPFPSLSRQERGTDTRGVSYFSGDIFFFLLGAIRIWSRCPAPIYTGQRDKPKQSGHPAGQLQGRAPRKPLVSANILVPFLRDTRDKMRDKAQKACPAGGWGAGQKRACPAGCPGAFSEATEGVKHGRSDPLRSPSACRVHRLQGRRRILRAVPLVRGAGQVPPLA